MSALLGNEGEPHARWRQTGVAVGVLAGILRRVVRGGGTRAATQAVR